ncbi:Polyamine oxidase 1 [Quillaja saponaria]|uniref:Polyamine oxidase 1 n=1 Tax=Quillaja saponaria TaxID=32244 RepID=A0AAD7P850_QUISA|nr:Polyamine oxidase 1 [Quillaja saponaria]
MHQNHCCHNWSWNVSYLFMNHDSWRVLRDVGILAAKTLYDAEIRDFLILEASDRIGGRIHKTQFGGYTVELGANWAYDGGPMSSPSWTIAKQLKLKSCFSDFRNLSSNVYKQGGGLYPKLEADAALKSSEAMFNLVVNLSKTLSSKVGKEEDISILASQRLYKKVPKTPLEMVLDYFLYDYEDAEPPRLTSLKNAIPRNEFEDFGDNQHFLADPRGFESIVHHIAKGFLSHKLQIIQDSRLKLNKNLENELPGSNILYVTITDEESRRIEQQSDKETEVEIMEVLRKLFGENIPKPESLLVPRWFSNKFFKGCFSNWPAGYTENRYEKLKEPVGPIYFTGEHTNAKYLGCTDGAYLAGIETANDLIRKLH